MQQNLNTLDCVALEFEFRAHSDSLYNLSFHSFKKNSTSEHDIRLGILSALNIKILLYFRNVIYKKGTYGYLQEVTVETVRLSF